MLAISEMVWSARAQYRSEALLADLLYSRDSVSRQGELPEDEEDEEGS